MELGASPLLPQRFRVRHDESGRQVVSMECRPNCGACCIAPSISSPIPGMPHGKPAGIPCVQLLPDMRCAIFGQPDYAAVIQRMRTALA